MTSNAPVSVGHMVYDKLMAVLIRGRGSGSRFGGERSRFIARNLVLLPFAYGVASVKLGIFGRRKLFHAGIWRR